MTFGGVLTLILLVLKLIGVVNFGWLIVFLPLLLSMVVKVLVIILAVLFASFN